MWSRAQPLAECRIPPQRLENKDFFGEPADHPARPQAETKERFGDVPLAASAKPLQPSPTPGVQIGSQGLAFFVRAEWVRVRPVADV